jgi:hypothetical protein
MKGFTFFDDPNDSQPTTQELIQAMSNEQKTGLVDAFAAGTSPTKAKHTLGLHSSVVAYFYAFFRQISNRADELMGDNDFDAAELLAAVYGEFDEEFTESQVQYILNKRVAYSKRDGSGDWAFYKSCF